MKVYSPSQTREFMQCPLKRALRRDGWALRETATRDHAALVGRAWAAGVGVYNTARMSGTVPPSIKMAMLNVAEMTLREGYAAINATGHTTDDPPSVADMLAKLDKAFTKYTSNDVIPPTWSIVAVEDDLGEDAGHARPDLLCRDQYGALRVVDYKLRMRLPAAYRVKTVAEYAASEQMTHYAYFVGRKYGEPVTQYNIILTVLEPSYLCDLLSYAIKEETLKMWHQSRQVTWARMEATDNGSTMIETAAEHSDRYGRCEYYKACFTYNLDSQLMVRDYVKETR